MISCLWLVCIFVRVLAVVVLWATSAGYLPFLRPLLPWMAIMAAIMGASMIYLWFSGSRMQARESSTGRTWWHAHRIVHGLLWMTAALCMAANDPKRAALILTVDVLVGLTIRHDELGSFLC